VDHINPVCSVPSEEVLLSVAVEATLVLVWSVHSALLGEEVRVLLAVLEAWVVLMSMEASKVASKLGVVMHAVVKRAEFVLLVRVPVVTSMITLVLLHRQVSIFGSWDVFASNLVIVASELVVAFLVEVESLRVKEVATWKNVETILIVLSRSVFDFLPSVLLDSRRRRSIACLTVLR